MTGIRISLLGGFRLAWQTGEAVPLASRKGRLLIARLASAPGVGFSRAYLQGQLWEDSAPGRGSASLRYLLHQLRRTLPAAALAALDIGGQRIRLDPALAAVDTAEFEALLRDGDRRSLERACALYRGDLLADERIDEPEYESWLLPERERLRLLALDGLWRKFRADVREGDVATAVDSARRYLEVDPYCERMHRALMRLHLAAGERAFAARHLTQVRHLLATDLQIAPDAETEAVLDARDAPAWGVARQAGLRSGWVLGESGATPPDWGRPLVAVLPFHDLSDKADAGRLAVALTEDVISDLARFRQLAVLARHTVFPLAQRPDRAQRLRDLGVRYCVEGSLRRQGARLTFTVGLIDAVSQRELWSERFRGDVADASTFQEEAVRLLVSRIAAQIEQADLSRLRHAWMAEMTAYDHYLRGREALRFPAQDREGHAIEHFRRALDSEPDFAPAHAGLALAYALTAWSISHLESSECVSLTIDHAQEAVRLDPADHQSQWILGFALQLGRQFATARTHLDRALALNPGDAETLAFAGLEYAYAGDAARGVAQSQEAIRLNPFYPPAFAEILGKCCFVARDYEQALFWLRQYPDRVTTNRAWLAASAAYAGLRSEAGEHARAFVRTFGLPSDRDRREASEGPLACLTNGARFRNAADLKHYERGLAMAGITDRLSSARDVN